MEHGCRRLNGADVQRVARSQCDDHMDVIRETVERESGAISEYDLTRLDAQANRLLSTYESTLSLSPGDVANAIVLSAEEVADYWATLPVGTNMLDVVASVAPPFQRMFVESQRRPNDLLGFESWGVFFEDEGRDADGDWVVVGSLVGEWSKREPVGPVVRWILPLDQNGMLQRGDETGHMSVGGSGRRSSCRSSVTMPCRRAQRFLEPGRVSRAGTRPSGTP